MDLADISGHFDKIRVAVNEKLVTVASEAFGLDFAVADGPWSTEEERRTAGVPARNRGFAVALIGLEWCV